MSSVTCSHTCSCLMVSPPLPMTRPTLLAGMRICWMELLPSISLWKPGPYRHCSTISLSSLLACLQGWSVDQENTFVTAATDPAQKLFFVKCWKRCSGDSVIQRTREKRLEFVPSFVKTIGHTFLILCAVSVNLSKLRAERQFASHCWCQNWSITTFFTNSISHQRDYINPEVSEMCFKWGAEEGSFLHCTRLWAKVSSSCSYD